VIGVNMICLARAKMESDGEAKRVWQEFNGYMSELRGNYLLTEEGTFPEYLRTEKRTFGGIPWRKDYYSIEGEEVHVRLFANCVEVHAESGRGFPLRGLLSAVPEMKSTRPMIVFEKAEPTIIDVYSGDVPKPDYVIMPGHCPFKPDGPVDKIEPKKWPGKKRPIIFKRVDPKSN
jgi:hypothetical protein